MTRALVLACALGGCFNPTYHDPKCGPGGECPDGFSCVAGTCRSGSIDDAPPGDMPDLPLDAQACFGSGDWELCFTSALPSAPATFSPGVFDTDVGPCASGVEWTSPAQPDTCVIAGTSIDITANTLVIGSKPLALVSTGTIMLATSIVLDVSSHRGASTGPGSQPALCTAFPVAPTSATTGAGGGAGGSFMSKGGNGGPSGLGAAPGQSPAADSAAPVVLRGGCSGQTGAAAAAGSEGPGGKGGGAVYLLASTSISLLGVINASGAGGSGAANTAGGGGGAGSGGMIVLAAPVITASNARLLANGGGGGGGGGSGGGMAGSDPSPSLPTVQASGGGGGAGNGCGGQGDGGNGATGTQGAGSGEFGSIGDDCGGGGGGGGVGFIRSSIAITGVTASPTITVAP
jgi:hypothetical protein